MKSIEEIKESIIQVELEITKYKKSFSGKPANWRVGKDMYDTELVEERNAFFKVMHIIDETIKSNNIIIGQLKNSDEIDEEKLSLVEKHNHDLAKFVIDFFK